MIHPIPFFAFWRPREAAATGSPQKVEKRDSAARIVTQVRPSVVDDFIRNFLIKVGMTRTLDAFNTEWYELQSKGPTAAQRLPTVTPVAKCKLRMLKLLGPPEKLTLLKLQRRPAKKVRSTHRWRRISWT